MSYGHYRESIAIIRRSGGDPAFYALVLAAARRADTMNLERLRVAFPKIIAELEARYNAPGGRLEGDSEGEIEWADRQFGA